MRLTGGSKVMGVAGSGPIRALKIALGSAGRADFLTSPEDWHGDLVYPDEEVSVFVEGCIWGGCPKHTLTIPHSWQERIRKNRKFMDGVEAFLDKRGWVTVKFWECEVARDPRAAAERILAALHQSDSIAGEQATKKMRTDTGLARLARIDAATRVSDQAWRRLLETAMSAGNNFNKRDMGHVLCAMENWDPAAFEELWQCARWHGIIKKTGLGFVAGEVMPAALREAGIKYRRKKLSQRNWVRRRIENHDTWDLRTKD